MLQEPPIGRAGLIIAPGDSASSSELLLELHDRLEEVDVEPQGTVERLQELQLPRPVVAVVADGAAPRSGPFGAPRNSFSVRRSSYCSCGRGGSG